MWGGFWPCSIAALVGTWGAKHAFVFSTNTIFAKKYLSVHHNFCKARHENIASVSRKHMPSPTLR